MRRWLSVAVVEEGKLLWRLAVPVIFTNALLMLLQIEDQVVLGHLGTDEMAAAGLGTVVFNLCWFYIIGAASAVDTLCAQAFGAGDFEATEYWTRMGFLVMTLMCIPAAVIYQFAEQLVKHVFRQPDHLARMAGRYCQLLLPGLWFLTMFCVMQKSLQAQGILMPSVWIMLLSNVLNIAGNLLFVFGLGMGFNGSPLATSVSRIITCLLLALYYFKLRKPHRKTSEGPGDSPSSPYKAHEQHGAINGQSADVPGSLERYGHPHSAVYHALPSEEGRDDLTSNAVAVAATDSESSNDHRRRRDSRTKCCAVESIPNANAEQERSGGKLPFWQGFRRFMSLAVPGGFMVGLEAWSFDWTVVLVARFGTKALDAHQSMMSISAFTFLSIPLAIAIAATIRIGNLLGAQQPKQARLAGRICMVAGTIIMAILGLIVVAVRSVLGKMFSPDPEVVRIVKHLAPIMALYQVMDGFQGVSAGLLRGMGQQGKVALLNLCGFWLLGLPGGAFMAFKLGLHVYGIWWGFVTGLSLVSLLYVFVLTKVDYEKEAKRALLAVTDTKLEQEWEEVVDIFDGHAAPAEHADDLEQPLLRGDHGAASVP